MAAAAQHACTGTGTLSTAALCKAPRVGRRASACRSAACAHRLQLRHAVRKAPRLAAFVCQPQRSMLAQAAPSTLGCITQCRVGGRVPAGRSCTCRLRPTTVAPRNCRAHSNDVSAAKRVLLRMHRACLRGEAANNKMAGSPNDQWDTVTCLPPLVQGLGCYLHYCSTWWEVVMHAACSCALPSCLPTTGTPPCLVCALGRKGAGD